MHQGLRFRVMLTMDVVPGMEKQFEAVWRDGADVIGSHPASLAHTLSRSTGHDNRYYIVSDWSDEESFRAFEGSDAHLTHRARLHPFRSSGSFDMMWVLGQTTEDGEGTAR